MPSQPRKRIPVASLQSSPLLCTIAEGAWPTINNLAVLLTRNTGLGLRGNRSSQIRHSRICREIESSSDKARFMGEDFARIQNAQRVHAAFDIAHEVKGRGIDGLRHEIPLGDTDTVFTR